MAILFLVLATFLCVASCQSAIPNEIWDYVEVRNDAYMFWWLYGASSSQERDQLPLIMWLQVLHNYYVSYLVVSSIVACTGFHRNVLSVITVALVGAEDRVYISTD